MSYEPSAMNEDHLQELLTNVWQETGYDFREYRHATIERRIAKRIILLGARDLADYRRILGKRPDEYRHLVSDLTIKVSRFFRNPYVFEAIDLLVWPDLLKAREQSKHLRIWSAGCAYGEETYSLAISVLDHIRRKKKPPKDYDITIMGTDIDEEALARARAGRYNASAVAEVKKRVLDAYFMYDPLTATYCVITEARDLVTFAEHDILAPAIISPPCGIITNYDLILCRNLLIYLSYSMQEKVLSRLLRVLNPGGYLILGKSEAVPPQIANGVQVYDKRANIYQKAKG